MWCVHVLQARLAGELEQHRLKLLSVFDNLHSRIMDAKTLAAAACKPVAQKDKVMPATVPLHSSPFGVWVVHQVLPVPW